MPNMRMRASVEGDAVVVRVLMTHPEDTGLMKGPDGKAIPAHYIQQVVCQLNGKTAVTGYWGTAISKNPFLEFHVKGGKSGDTVSVSWLDNEGQTQSATATVG